jgi:hypothetical protein
MVVEDDLKGVSSGFMVASSRCTGVQKSRFDSLSRYFKTLQNIRELMRALLLGNSQIICNCNVPELLRRISASSPDPRARIEVDSVTIGGATIEKLWADGRSAATIQKGGWDWVLCHEIVYSYGGKR